MNIKIATLIFCLLQFAGCKKEAKAFAAEEFSECDRKTDTDSILIQQKLPGNWKLIQTWSEKAGTTKPKNKIELAIYQQGLFELYEDDKVVTTGTWQLERKDMIFFHLRTNPRASFTNGIILSCEQKLLFNNSHWDGTDNLFQRID